MGHEFALTTVRVLLKNFCPIIKQTGASIEYVVSTAWNRQHGDDINGYTSETLGAGRGWILRTPACNNRNAPLCRSIVENNRKIRNNRRAI